MYMFKWLYINKIEVNWIDCLQQIRPTLQVLVAFTAKMYKCVKWSRAQNEGWISSSSHWLACNESRPVFSDPQSIVTIAYRCYWWQLQWKSFENNDTLAESKRRKDNTHWIITYAQNAFSGPWSDAEPGTWSYCAVWICQISCHEYETLQRQRFFVIQYYRYYENTWHIGQI